MTEDTPTFEELVSSKLDSMPMDTPGDLVAVAKKRFRLEALLNRITASRQEDFPQVRYFAGRADGLVSAIEVLDDVFSEIYQDEDDGVDDANVEQPDDDVEANGDEQGVY